MAAATGAAMAAAVTPAAAAQPTTVYVSAETFTGGGESPSVSADGRYTVVIGKGQGQAGLWKIDTVSGQVVAHAANVHGAARVDISGGGRYVAYAQEAKKGGGAYVWDTKLDPTGAKPVVLSAAVSAGSPAISDDGRFVAFVAPAAGAVGGGPLRVYLRDRDSDDNDVYDEPGTVTDQVVSWAPGDDPVEVSGTSPDVTPDGRYVVFESDDPTLGVPAAQVYVRDVERGVTTLVSVGEDGAAGDAASAGTAAPSISDDGTLVAFESQAGNLAVLPDPATPRTYPYVASLTAVDTATAVTVRALLTDAAPLPVLAADPCTLATEPVPLMGGAPVLSGDGTTVAFTSEAPLTTDDTNGRVIDAYRLPLADPAAVERVSVAVGGTEASGCLTTMEDDQIAAVNGDVPQLSRTGQVVVFTSNGDLLGQRASKVLATYARLFGQEQPYAEPDGAPVTPPAPPPVTPPSETPTVPAAGLCPADIQQPFRDVDVGSPHAAAVACMYRYGVVLGSGSGAFTPGQPVTRGQMAAFMTRVLAQAGVVLPVDPPDAFVDDTRSVHHLAINQLAALGVVRGQVAGAYAPDALVTRAEMATFLTRAYAATGGTLPVQPADVFADDATTVHHPAINQAAALGFVVGAAGGDYLPQLATQRDQMATFLFRLMTRLHADGKVAAR